ncbi:hypothetical protein J2S00_003346 [Caldalkalibacillus uzonensis]|uniref:Uncharacterized protein n=1 Tax=Caldalkalibacillus uzonensis TaxID=353224 RepID=A0ABU0CVS0_9BACI|nr:hypothetical protein [Caldalkalibacillus uzonensis]MDQ0340522.1 hypothetical protein [Caldalkalibacillus uzonensis]
MSNLTDIKQKILQLEGGAFQELCDAYLSKIGYDNILALGMKPGTKKTTIGIPDTYFLNSQNKYIFVMYTTQQSDIYKKLYQDICDCLNPEKTGVETANIAEIICCFTSSNLSAGEHYRLMEVCRSKGVLLHLIGIDELAKEIYNRFHGLARDFLGLSIGTDQIFEYRQEFCVSP